MDAEDRRLEETRSKAAPWRKWGPYLSERQWRTVREDHSDSGNAWTTSPTTRPAREPIAGARTGSGGSPMTGNCSASRWRGGTARTPSFKERSFGLTNSEGNHGEDVKEYY
jgi:hypothetical protein